MAVIRGVIVLGLLIWFVSLFAQGRQTSDSQPTRLAEVQAAPPPPPAPIAQPSCKTDWKLCPDNATMANDFDGWTLAQVKCQDAANDTAKYGKPEWPWMSSFGSFLKGNEYSKAGKATLIEPDAQFQNAFGAMAHTKVYCDYDLASKTVTGINVTPK